MKNCFKSYVRASKLLAYPHHILWLTIEYDRSALHNPLVNKVRYPFRGSLAYFIGAALYF